MMKKQARAPVTARCLHGVVAAVALTLASVSMAAGVEERRESPRFIYSPYKDITLSFDSATHELRSAVSGVLSPLVANGRSALPAAVKVLTWAFAVGECGQETWMGVDAQKFAAVNVPAFNAAGIGYIISTGGEAGVFTCGSDVGMEAFIARYASPRLVGIDFDIEGKQTPAMIESLVQRVSAAQRKHPQLRFSFTLATLAASDGSRANVNALGQSVLRAIRVHGLVNYTINLMVMDYGPPQPSNCVVTNGVCSMGRSAIQAAENLNALHGVAFSQIELTPMIGVNDVPLNDFTLDDARVIARYSANKGLAGIRFWSLDRDQPCSRPPSGASPHCSGFETVPALGYSAAFDPGQR
jgi:chitinase